MSDEDPRDIIYNVRPDEMPLSALGLPARFFNPMHNEGIYTVQALIDFTSQELMRLPYFGKVGVCKVRAALKVRGLSLLDDRGRPHIRQSSTLCERLDVIERKLDVIIEALAHKPC